VVVSDQWWSVLIVRSADNGNSNADVDYDVGVKPVAQERYQNRQKELSNGQAGSSCGHRHGVVTAGTDKGSCLKRRADTSHSVASYPGYSYASHCGLGSRIILFVFHPG